jgi:crotonobetainyl-CoA:carnitine CoA-transferase CaiB-like acyl-CoA transferase
MSMARGPRAGHTGRVVPEPEPESPMPVGPESAAGLALELCDALGVRTGADRLRVTGAEPILAARYPLATRAAAVLGAIGLVASALWEQRGGAPQTVSVDLRHAGALMRGFYDMEIDGQVLDDAPTDRLALARAYECRDGRRLALYAVMAPASAAMLALLRAEDDVGSIAAAIRTRDADDWERRCAEAGLPATIVRSAEEWAAHPQGRELAQRPLVSITQVGEAPPVDAGDGIQPLSGVRVLDLCRIVAGPVCGRTLGEHGGEVLSVIGSELDWIRRAMIDTAPGKRNAVLQLSQDALCRRLSELAAQADVFCQGSRPGRMAARGLGVADLCAIRPGLVYVSIDGWGASGPWASRPGFEALAHAATGWTHDHAVAGTPQPLTELAGDHLTGYLAALGALAALHRRHEIGGSWHVEVSLCRVVSWLRDGGAVRPAGAEEDLSVGATRDLRIPLDGGFGRVLQLRPAPGMSATSPRWRFGAYPPGTHEARFSMRHH